MEEEDYNQEGANEQPVFDNNQYNDGNQIEMENVEGD
jgi:hypothetical protein